MKNKELVTTINVLGTDYKVLISTPEKSKVLQKCDGCILPEIKTIYLDVRNKKQHQEHVLAHELVHAFLYESGLDVESWACNEEIVDWIALQINKIYTTVKQGINSFNRNIKETKKDDK